MARTKAFDVDHALDAAIGVFREHGYAGTSAGMLTEAMRIGRQSLYDTFGDKWTLYCAAVRRYSDFECRAHLEALKGSARAIDGLRAMMARVVAEARQPCLGVGSISEFGSASRDLGEVHKSRGKALRKVLVAKIREAQKQGDLNPQRNAEQAAGFLIANVAGIRLSARGGSDDKELKALGELAIQALR